MSLIGTLLSNGGQIITGNPAPGTAEARHDANDLVLANAIGTIISGSSAGTALDTDPTTIAIFDITATGSFTLNNPTPAPTAPKRFLWRVWNNSVSAINVSLGLQFIFGLAVPSLPAVPANKVLYIAAIYRTLGGVTVWDIVAADVFTKE